MQRTEGTVFCWVPPRVPTSIVIDQFDSITAKSLHKMENIVIYNLYMIKYIRPSFPPYLLNIHCDIFKFIVPVIIAWSSITKYIMYRIIWPGFPCSLFFCVCIISCELIHDLWIQIFPGFLPANGAILCNINQKPTTAKHEKAQTAWISPSMSCVTLSGHNIHVDIWNSRCV